MRLPYKGFDGVTGCATGTSGLGSVFWATGGVVDEQPFPKNIHPNTIMTTKAKQPDPALVFVPCSVALNQRTSRNQDTGNSTLNSVGPSCKKKTAERISPSRRQPVAPEFSYSARSCSWMNA
jgi:hypothetical protein